MPKNMMVELSNGCNHACIFCTSPYMTRKIGRIDKSFLFQIMADARALGVEEIGFYTTGDPFVHTDLDKFTSQAKALGFSYIYISTNGALASPERAKAVIDAGMDSIKFSINAASRESYELIHGRDDWDLVMANLRFISEYRRTLGRPLKLFITSVVTTQNAHEIEKFKAEVKDLVDEIIFTAVQNQSGQMNSAQDILSADGGTSFKTASICTMPFNRLHVSCEGYLTLCCVDYQNYLAVADLRHVPLKDAWTAPEFRTMRERHLSQSLEGTLCGNCWQGRRDRVEPVRSELATEIDFPKLYDKVGEIISDRLHSEKVGGRAGVRKASRAKA